MALIDYPDGMPLPLREGYAFEPTNNIRRTPQDSGRARQRVEFRNVPTFPTLTWHFSASEASLFEAWQAQVVGSAWFNVTLLTPLGFETVEARFTEVPRGGELIGKFSWRYRAVCEVRTRPLLDEGWAELLPEYILEADIFDYAMNREWPLYYGEFDTYASLVDLAATLYWPEGA
jgi:hypothetical protein